MANVVHVSNLGEEVQHFEIEEISKAKWKIVVAGLKLMASLVVVSNLDQVVLRFEKELVASTIVDSSLRFEAGMKLMESLIVVAEKRMANWGIVFQVIQDQILHILRLFENPIERRHHSFY